MKLSDYQKTLIKDIIEDLFNQFLVKLIGPYFTGPRIYFELLSDKDLRYSLEGLFRYTVQTLYGTSTLIDPKQIEDLSNTTEQYFEAEKLKMINRVFTLSDQAKNLDELQELLMDDLDKTSKRIELLVTTETKMAQANAERDGIVKVASSLGISDPTVAKLGILDHKICKDCLDLWHLPSNPHIPKVYKLSELRNGYMIKSQGVYPTIGSTHPRCRHILTFIPPNMGFDESGRLKFIALGYDIYAEQRKGE